MNTPTQSHITSLSSSYPKTKKPIHDTKIIVGMSGGVDSSVSALLLKQQGYQVEGLFMKNWDEDDGTEYCSAASDLLDAAAVCQTLDIYLHTINFARDYWDNVFEHFLTQYRAGLTPNPDILCNREIKFKVFLDHAKRLGADAIATGHYVRTQRDHNNQTHLLKGIDAGKDQSYFLYAVQAKALAKSHFPIGHIEKQQVRHLAEKHSLVTHNKKDSTGICFIGERRFKDFLSTYLPAQPGPITTPSGKVVGEHQGLMYHTIGQRQGLGIGGMANTNNTPWYVASKDLVSNTLVVVQGSEHPLLFKSTLTANQLHWINDEPQDLPMRCMAKTRYRQQDQACLIEKIENDQIYVSFEQPQRAITPGQSVVFYQQQRCLGGAVILF